MLQLAAHTELNRRPQNEDAYFISYFHNKHKAWKHHINDINKLELHLNEDTISHLVLGVCDGHGGGECSDFLSRELPSRIAQIVDRLSSESETDFGNLLGKQINGLFKHIDAEFMAKSPTNCTAGSTCTVVVCRQVQKARWNVFCFNLGDSEAFFVRGSEYTELTHRHDLNNEQEVQRVQESGGFVFRGRVNGILNLTRSIGDRSLKKFDPLVNPLPETRNFSDNLISCIPSARCADATKDNFILVASDGLLERLLPEEAINTLLRSYSVFQSLSLANQSLIERAVNASTLDNVTVLLLKL